MSRASAKLLAWEHNFVMSAFGPEINRLEDARWPIRFFPLAAGAWSRARCLLSGNLCCSNTDGARFWDLLKIPYGFLNVGSENAEHASELNSD